MEQKDNSNTDFENTLKRLVSEKIGSDQSLEDALIITGMLDQTQGQIVLSSLESARNQTIEQETILLNKERELLQQLLDQHQLELVSGAKSREGKERQLGEIQAKIDEIDAEIQQQEQSRLSLSKELMRRRQDYPEKVLTDNLNKRRSMRKQILEDFRDEWNTKTGLRNQLHEESVRILELNKEEYKRRVDFLKERVERSRGFQTKVEDLLSVLATVGINRTSVGFLVWAGYIGLPALGWFIGELLYKTYQGDIGVFQDLFGLLAAAEGSLFQNFGFGWGLVAMLLLPVIALALIIVVFFALHFITSRLVGSHNEMHATGQKKPSTQFAKASWWNVLPFSRFDFFTSLGSARNDSTQRLLTIYLWIVGPFIIGALFYLGITNPQYPLFLKELRNQGIMTNALFPWSSLIYTYLGVVICLVFSSFAVVYVTRVVQPRLVRLEQKDEITLANLLKANIEVISLALLVVGATVVYDSLHLVIPSLPRLWSPDALGLVFVLVIANAISLAYGITFRGLFRDSESLKTEVQAYEDEMQRYSVLPSVEMPEGYWKQFEDRLKAIEEEIDRVWSSADFYSMPLTSYPIISYLANQSRSILSGPQQRQAAQDIQLGFTKYDAIYEADLSSSLTDAFERLNLLEQSKHRSTIELNEIKKHIVDDEEKEKNIHSQINELRKRLVELERRFALEITRINQNFTGVMTRASNALKIGSLLAGHDRPFRTRPIEPLREAV